MRILTLSLAATALLVGAADAQPRRAMTQTASDDAQRISCDVGAIQMTADGLAFNCRVIGAASPTYYRMAFDGGNRPGGISAAMSLLTFHAQAFANSDEGIVVRYSAPSERAQSICDAVDGGLNANLTPDCFEAISLSTPTP